MNFFAPLMLDPMLKATVQEIAAQVLAQNPTVNKPTPHLEPQITPLPTHQTPKRKAA